MTLWKNALRIPQRPGRPRRRRSTGGWRPALYPERVAKIVRARALHEATVWADADGLHVDFAGGHAWAEWSILTAVTETDATIVMWRGRLPSYILPMRAFPTLSDADAFVS